MQARSDVAAVTNEIGLTSLQQDAERQKLNPEFGVRFEHMIVLGSMPTQYTLMAMVKIPFARWSSKGVKAKVESLKWKAVAQDKQREAVINEALGDAYAVKSEMEERKKQIKLYEVEIIPALRRNYQTTQLAYEQNTERLFVLYDAWVQVPQLGDKKLEGKIEFASPEINQQTRINLLRVSIPNPGNELKPGMPAYIHVNSAVENNAIALPANAVMRTNKTAFVWVQTGKNKFSMQTVVTGAENGNEIEIKQGLKPNAAVVISGAYLLNSEYLLRNGSSSMEGMKM